MPTGRPECPFCEIVQQDDPVAREVYRDDHVVAFFPTEPAVLGHVLLVPRRHVPDIWSLKPEEAARLSRTSLRISSAIRDALVPDGLNVIQSNGEAATQSVPHLHIHLVPRWDNDAVGPIWPDETDFSEAEKDKALQRVRGAVGNLAVEAPALSPDDRRKHLDYIQAVVTRQSAASASVKGWLLPIVTATFGFALTQDSWPLAALGLVSVMLFAYLDANYLRSEKRFRKLYNTVARSRRMVPDFTLDPSDADEPPEDGMSAETKWRAFVRDYLPEWGIWKSWSILPFYSALAVIGVGVVIVVAT
ncbi:HIT family protein [Cutibacterium namnetense]|uniref:HIT family protein n=1 Tax=Cutibacterium namnetense TaxID=1574624 RepID=UPI00254DF2BD|nr:HIT family protein [Cutibacterium namnetense]